MRIKVKNIIDEDFVNYKKPSMFIIFPYCTFKCDKENGTQICQNWSVANQPNIEIDTAAIVERYMNNPITSALVCGGLEPFDTPAELFDLIVQFRSKTEDDIVIYTGYKEEEIQDYIDTLSEYKNIIIKFGRFIPDKPSHYDEILGVYLASSNQYAKKLTNL